MNTKKLLMIGAGAVVLYFVWKKFGTSTETEETAGANGRVCKCQNGSVHFGLTAKECEDACTGVRLRRKHN